MLKILAIGELNAAQQQAILGVAPQVDLTVVKARDLSSQSLADAEIVVTMQFTQEMFQQARSLKWVQATSAGVDKMMFPDMVRGDVMVTNVRGMHGTTISEFVMTMMLALARQLPRSVRNQDHHVWERIPQRMLDGSTVGIIGVGGIGHEIARRANAFGMKTLGSKRNVVEKMEYVDQLYSPDHLDELLQQSDFVVLACPLTQETRGLVNAATLRRMKPTAYLINIARGEVVDEPALIQALQERVIAGAALDVFTQEPLAQDSPLWDFPNVIITSHVAGSMDDYMDRAVKVFTDNLRRYLDGRPLLNLVDKTIGY